jgi:hypothetical protein
MIFLGPLGNGVTSHWYGSDANGWGVVHMGESAASDITLYTHSTLQEDIMIHYDVLGEVYGGPPHNVIGDISLRNLGPETPWMALSDTAGLLTGNSADSINITVDATGLEDGTYSAWILLQDNFGHEITVPVNLVVDQFLGNQENVSKDQPVRIDVYPNPTQGNTFIDVKLDEPSGITVNIANAHGQPVRSIQSPTAANSHQLSWDGRDNHGNQLPEGIYIIKVFSGNVSGQTKIIVLD